MVNPQWFELRMSRTNSHGPKDVRGYCCSLPQQCLLGLLPPICPFSMEGESGLQCICYLFYKRNPYVDANSVDPDQTPCSMACDQGLHCQCFGDARH